MNNKRILSAILMAGAMVAFASCAKEDPDEPGHDEDQPQTIHTVSTPTVSGITESSVTLSASTDAAAFNIVDEGFCYSSLTSTPTLSNNYISCKGSSFEATLTDLTPGTVYYVRAYVKTDKYIYSETVTFTTSQSGNLDDYVAPSYADDYRSISGWDYRSKWNLSNVHDPTVCLADDGYYYMYQTDASYGNAHEGHGHFHGRRSKNLVDWEYLGGTMDSCPKWILEKCNEYRAKLGLAAITNPSYGYWAPCVRKVNVNGKTIYRMYYSVVIDNYIGNGQPSTTTFDGTWTERAFIGLMETSDPSDNSSWEDKGFVICSASDKGTNYKRSSTDDWEGYFKFNAIDPSYIVTPAGEHWLIYGSWHSGIAAVQLDPTTGKTKATLPDPWGTADEIAPYGKLIESRGGRWQGSEGPEIVYHDGYYYLFVAYDGLAVPYNTRVVRSTNVDGPYYDLNGSDATSLSQAYPIETHPYAFSTGWGWVGISHCAIFEDGNDNWFYASQARYPENAGGNAPNAIMLGHVRKVLWGEDGWPLVMPERYGAVPDVAITSDEIAGTWEHIDLSYKYGEMRTSSEMVFGSDGKISSGAWSGATWSFDPGKNVVTISNGVKLYVCRECDWESSPRKATIVYAAHGKNKTYWGKKK